MNWLVAAAVAVLAAFAVADGLRSGRSSTKAAATTTEPETGFAPRRSQKLEIARIGNRWAALFARDKDDCYHMTQPLCERVACERVGHGQVKIRNCTPPTSAFRRSFEGATITDIEVRPTQAAARFSNDEVVELRGDAGTWWIQELGASAGRGFFE